MQLVIDPLEVEHLAEERKDENWKFRDWIKETFICPIVFNVVERMKVELAEPDDDELDWPGW